LQGEVTKAEPVSSDMMGWMRRRPSSRPRFLVLAALVLIVGIRPSTPWAQPSRAALPEPVEGPSETVLTARAFLEAINEVRRAEGSAPLEPSEALTRVADLYVEKAVFDLATTDVGIEARLDRDDFQTSAYDPHQWAVGLVSLIGEPAEIIIFWRQTDPQGFEAFLEPNLRDFGLAEGVWSSQPVYALVGAVSRAQTHQPIIDRLSDLEAIGRQLLDRVNEKRRRRGVGELRLSRQLTSAAQGYADRMVEEGFYGHVSPSGDTVLQRVEATGYRPEHTGENLASGPDTVAAAMDGWMASKGHRRNILNSRFRDIGFGLSVRQTDGELTILWVQCFGTRRP